MLGERRDQFHAAPFGKGTRRRERRAPEKVNAAVAESFGSVARAVFGNEFDINALLLEEAELHRRRCHEIGR
jgi:hypothetical protein